MGADVSNFVAMIQRKRQQALKVVVKAIDIFGEHVLGDAQQLCPIDTGALAASGTTTPAQESGGIVTKAIGFNVSYAAPVHENLNAHHEIGQAKFLSTAMDQNAPKLAEFVRGRLEAELGEE